jgi:arylsulfatase A
LPLSVRQFIVIGSRKKGQVFEGGVRVCCLVRYPPLIPAGTVNTQFLTAMEWFPTLLNLVGVQPPEDIVLDGFDMLPVLSGQRPSPRESMFWKRRGLQAARVGHWKWIDNNGEKFLFDLSEDIGEKNNLIQVMPEMAAQMEGHFQRWMQSMEGAEPRGPFRDY